MRAGDLQRATQRDADVREIAAHAGFVAQGVGRRRRAVADPIAVLDVLVNPSANRFDLVVAGGLFGRDLLRQRLERVGRAVATRQQELERVFGQVLDFRGRRSRLDEDLWRDLDRHLGAHAEVARGSNQALAQISETIDVLGGLYERLEIVLVLDDPLRQAAARAKHRDQRLRAGRDQCQFAAGA